MRIAAALAGLVVAAVPAMAAETIPEPVALLQGLDKITARVSQFEAPVDKAVRFGDLSIVVRDCERNTPEERPENAAFLQIYELRRGEQQTRIFSGWMFSSSPALSALEHPIYDINVLECLPAAGSASTSPAAAPPPPPSASAPAANTPR